MNCSSSTSCCSTSGRSLVPRTRSLTRPPARNAASVWALSSGNMYCRTQRSGKANNTPLTATSCSSMQQPQQQQRRITSGLSLGSERRTRRRGRTTSGSELLEKSSKNPAATTNITIKRWPASSSFSSSSSTDVVVGGSREVSCRAKMWPLSERDYPEGEIVLGMEIREHSVKAALVDTGCGEFVRPGVVKTIEDNSMDGVLSTAKEVVKAYGWKGMVGCSVTRAVWRKLGHSQAEKALSGAIPNLSNKIAVMIHTEAAAYAEMRCGVAKNNSNRVLILTVGKNLGVVVYEDGEKVRGLDVSHLFWKWELELKELQEKFSFEGISPPPPQLGKKPDRGWLEWTKLCSKFLGKICQHVKPATVVVEPTGSVVKQPRDVFLKHISLGMPSEEVEVVVGSRPEGAIIRGAAIGAFKELNTLQASTQLKDCILEHLGSENLHLVSNQQLHGVFNLLDENKDGTLTLAELQQNASKIGLLCTNAELHGLMRYLCQNKREVKFAEFCAWWREIKTSLAIKHVMSSTELNEVCNSEEQNSIVFVGGKACPACKKLQAAYLQLALDYTDVNFFRMNMDSNRSTWKYCKDHNIKHVPTFLFFRSGNLVESIKLTTPESLEVNIKRLHEAEFLMEPKGVSIPSN